MHTLFIVVDACLQLEYHFLVYEHEVKFSKIPQRLAASQRSTFIVNMAAGEMNGNVFLRRF